MWKVREGPLEEVMPGRSLGTGHPIRLSVAGTKPSLEKWAEGHFIKALITEPWA